MKKLLMIFLCLGLGFGCMYANTLTNETDSDRTQAPQKLDIYVTYGYNYGQYWVDFTYTVSGTNYIYEIMIDIANCSWAGGYGTWSVIPYEMAPLQIYLESYVSAVYISDAHNATYDITIHGLPSRL